MFETNPGTCSDWKRQSGGGQEVSLNSEAGRGAREGKVGKAVRLPPKVMQREMRLQGWTQTMTLNCF